MQPLPSDWRNFFAALGEGLAAFGLFDLPDRGSQPVLLIHATPHMEVPQEVLLRSVLDLYRGDVYVVRLCVEIQAFPSLQDSELRVFMRDEPLRDVIEFPFMASALLRFETFLNPVDSEDRTILQKLEQVSVLFVSIVQSNQMRWGKQFPWRERYRSAIRQILKETQKAAPVKAQAWQKAKEQVMEGTSL